MRFVLIIDQIVSIVATDKDNVPSAAAIAAVWAAPRFIFLPTKTHAPAATVAGLNFDNAFVDKHGEKSSRDNAKASALRREHAEVAPTLKVMRWALSFVQEK